MSKWNKNYMKFQGLKNKMSEHAFCLLRPSNTLFFLFAARISHSQMFLLWNLKKTSFWFTDQTPTPTRFLKNCEEVGLFSDLDCSIEQEFCKAQEEEDSKQVLQHRGQSLRKKKKKQEKKMRPKPQRLGG